MCVCVYEYMCVCVYEYKCMCVCVYEYMCVCVCVYEYKCVHEYNCACENERVELEFIQVGVNIHKMINPSQMG